MASTTGPFAQRKSGLCVSSNIIFRNPCSDCLYPLQKCRVTAHSLLGVHKDGMNALIRSMKLADRVTYVRGDPSYVPFTSHFFFHPVSTHCRRKELHLDYPNNTFDMVRLSYCSLNLAETEVSTTVWLTRMLVNCISSGTFFYRSVYLSPFPRNIEITNCQI